MAMDVFTSLAPRARWLFHLQAMSRLVLFWVPVTAVGTAAGMALWSPFYAPLVAVSALFVLFLLSVWFPSLSFERWGYILQQDDLLIRRGVVVRTITAIPTERIQHVDTRQGPLEQWLGLARVQVHTASGLGADGIIPGLWLDDAEALRDELVALGGRGDDGV